MKRSVITVTEAARTFADCVNRVHYQGMSFLLLKNGKPVARLEPNVEKTCSAHKLAEVIKRTEGWPVGLYLAALIAGESDGDKDRDGTWA